jgi:hypothetical protein
MAQAMTLLENIPEVTALIIGRVTNYPDRGFSQFSPVLRSKHRDSVSNQATTDIR